MRERALWWSWGGWGVCGRGVGDREREDMLKYLKKGNSHTCPLDLLAIQQQYHISSSTIFQNH